MFLFLFVGVGIEPGRREVDNLKFWQAVAHFVRVVRPDDGPALISYSLAAFLAQAVLDLFAIAALVFIDDHFVQIRLGLKAVAQLAPVQVEQALVEIVQGGLQDVAVKPRAKGGAEQLALKDAALKLAAAAEAVEQRGGGDARAWKVSLQVRTLLYQQFIDSVRSGLGSE